MNWRGRYWSRLLTCLKIRICFKRENARNAVTVLTYKDLAAQHCVQPAGGGSGQRSRASAAGGSSADPFGQPYQVPLTAAQTDAAVLNRDFSTE